ncbi:Protein of unknown function, Putative carbamoyl-phosphate synthase [Flavobacterium indicum GPTSA100-9 = DSM 17447]|uniref:ATP-grasp domain-containing protein n=1 Tax=Flavobacterium indicum (strain DSM 17447 / CIP 109464 / GPTSA100-9) TaxID=1094466 RepID=H8XT77_FLAIG|nr:ATP-grasp domain-containing protein [Flavobacterium indicum]CCG52674.1 Protein of unknown function, Putative carbamoyl-phosphate synthase [Flavobacterium indicum GPTSA100-9 = DSM 17447]
MKKLAIIGASYLQLPLVQKANEMGIETHCFAWPEGAVCKEVANYFYPISILDKQAILKQCSIIGIDGITTIATDMAVPTISYVANELGLVANSVFSSMVSTNKGAMREIFERYNCSIPKFQKIKSTQEKIKTFQYPLIVKPADRSGSRGVSKVVDENLLNDAIEYAISESFSKEAIIEEFIDGVEVSVETISWNGEHYILAITDKTTTSAPHFVELAHHQPSNLTADIQKKIKEETIKCLNVLDIKYGASHSEFKINANGEVVVIEVGARMGGDFIGSHLVQLSTGYDFVKGVIAIALGTFEKPVISHQNFSGVYFLSKETECILPYFKKSNEFDVEKLIQNEDLQFLQNSNDRSGYLIYQSNQRVNLI